MNFQLLLVTLAIAIGQQALAAPPAPSSKVFNYQGFMPIRDDRTGELVREDGQPLAPAANELALTDAEAACWRLINDQSVVTFALQRKVLDEFDGELARLNLTEKLRDFITRTTGSLRQNMDEAQEALKKDSAESFFDALFATSEDIISLSAIVREPELSEPTFLVFIKAISRLGRNNAELIQDFAEMCAFAQKGPGPKPRAFWRAAAE